MSKHIVIYHKACADGFGAALAVKVYLDELQRSQPNEKGLEVEFIPAQYGDAPPAVGDAHVHIVDFSYPRDVLIKLKSAASSLVVLDHHKTARVNLVGLPYCYFDMEKSGAMMAWLYYNKNKPVPKLIQYIQDRDLWQWKLPYSREISTGLKTLPFNFDTWTTYLDDELINDLYWRGEPIYKQQQTEVYRIAQKANFTIVSGHTVPSVNTATLISEVGEKLCVGHPFSLTYFLDGNSCICSLRSNQSTGIDVSEIAKKFGGGGHRNAAGFTLNVGNMFHSIAR